MVGPTNLKPRAASSLEMRIDSGVDAGTLAVVLKRFDLWLAVDEVHSHFEKPARLP